MMEGTLESAVKIGAENLLRQVRSAVPDPPMLASTSSTVSVSMGTASSSTSACRCSGPGHLPLRALITSDNRDPASVAAELKQLIAQMDARYQPQFAQAVRRLEMRAQAQNPIALRAPGGGTVAAGQVAVAPPANVDARVLDNPAEVARARSSRRSSTR